MLFHLRSSVPSRKAFGDEAVGGVGIGLFVDHVGGGVRRAGDYEELLFGRGAGLINPVCHLARDIAVIVAVDNEYRYIGVFDRLHSRGFLEVEVCAELAGDLKKREAELAPRP